MAAIGGLTFVLVNAGGLPDPWPWLLQGLSVLVFIWTLLRLRQPGALPSGQRPDARSWRTYMVSVGLMLLAFPLGARLLNMYDFAELVVLWIVLVVGLHFFPFAQAFGTPVFRNVAASLVAAALVGMGLALLGVAWGPAAGAVAAGFALLGYSGGLGQRAAQPA